MPFDGYYLLIVSVYGMLSTFAQQIETIMLKILDKSRRLTDTLYFDRYLF
jgi:hypothetical protein